MGENVLKKERIPYVDVLKFLGIFAIYIGHFLDAGGFAHDFVFQYHVPLFFFISGCMVTVEKTRKFFPYFIHKVQTILLPWLFFALLAVIVKVLDNNQNISHIREYLKLIVLGCERNNFIAAGLWFLTCLFVMSIAFHIIQKVRSKILMLIICVLLLLLQQGALGVRMPGFFNVWNISSAMYYLLYYCLGYVLFPYIHKFLKTGSVVTNSAMVVTGIFAAAFSALLFFGKNLFGFLYDVPFLKYFAPVLVACIVIWLNVLAAYCLRNVQLFQNIGRTTLYLCGSEFLVKTLVFRTAELFGLNIQVLTPLAVYIYTYILLVITYKFLVPVEKSALNAILNTAKSAWNSVVHKNSAATTEKEQAGEPQTESNP